MTLDEAIEIQQHYLKGISKSLDYDFPKAIKLGIEALKRLNDWRRGEVINPFYMLEGETEE